MVVFYVQVLAKIFPSGEQLTELITTLMDGLMDTQPMSSNGACVVLNGITKLRGAELQSQVSVTVSDICLTVSDNCLTFSGTRLTVSGIRLTVSGI